MGRTARKLTSHDKAVISAVAGETLYIDTDGKPYLHNGELVSRYRFNRLIELQLIEPHDRPLLGTLAQSYGLKPIVSRETSEATDAAP